MSVYKKNNKWYCEGVINHKRYHRLCVNCQNKREAIMFEYNLRHYNTQVNKKYTVKELMQRYVEVCMINNKSYKKAITQQKFIVEYFTPDKLVETITSYDIEKFKMCLINRGRSKATVNRYLAAIRRAYNILLADGVINSTPMKSVRLYNEDNHRYRYLSKDEWERLKQCMPEHLLNIVKIALLTGFRRSNVLQLRWEQINLELGFIEIAKQDNKSGKLIRKPITDTLKSIFIELGVKKKGYLFINPKTNKPYTTVRKSFNTALKKAGIEDFKFHDLRRTVGTWLLNSGVDIRTIQSLLDHSDVRTTERYLAITSENNFNALKKMECLI